MSIFDKLKTVFFEEEYVEVEEPVKRKKEKEPIAKKIELPEIRRKKDREKEKEPEEIFYEERKEEPKEENILDSEIAKKNNSSFKFPMNFEEEDFKNDFSYAEEEMTAPKHRETQKEHKKETPKEIIKEGLETTGAYSSNYSGLYEGNLESRKKKEFKPTPIISPIYGILDKNYTKDEIVTKKEVRISSSPKNVDLDTVREKAYGDLASDITASMYEDESEEEEKEEKGDDNLLYDLNESSSPAVTKVTVGDAEEYYNDLGLEYNVDYKDTSKEKAAGRRTKKADKEEKEIQKESKEETVVEDNLFDLIDSMYEDKE